MPLRAADNIHATMYTEAGDIRNWTDLLAHSLSQPLYVAVMRHESAMRLHHLFQKRLLFVDSGYFRGGAGRGRRAHALGAGRW